MLSVTTKAAGVWKTRARLSSTKSSPGQEHHRTIIIHQMTPLPRIYFGYTAHLASEKHAWQTRCLIDCTRLGTWEEPSFVEGMTQFCAIRLGSYQHSFIDFRGSGVHIENWSSRHYAGIPISTQIGKDVGCCWSIYIRCRAVRKRGSFWW